MTSSPAAIAGTHRVALEHTVDVLLRVARLAVLAAVAIGGAREAYRLGYQDGYRVADQVAADRPLEVPA